MRLAKKILPRINVLSRDLLAKIHIAIGNKLVGKSQKSVVLNIGMKNVSRLSK